MTSRFDAPAAFATSFVCLAIGLVACSKLTAPPAEDVTAESVPDSGAAQAPTASAAAAPTAVASAAVPGTDVKLGITDTLIGTGQEAKTGDTVSVHYVGTLTDGTEFDQSRKRGQPFKFKLGEGHVIKGWDQGVVGMKVGGKRKLVIPPSLGYGMRGAPPVIPPNATLNFDIELMSIP